MTDIIFHHFEASPFSEKIRLIFGRKKLAWKSCLVPRILPKPDLMPLTGGYRRTPVMQIGADIYCDTQLIVRELERRFPQPPLMPAALGGINGVTAMALSTWSDKPMFQITVPIVFGTLGDKAPEGFAEDRANMRGAPFDIKAMTAALPALREQYRAQMTLIETQLADGRAFLLGEPSLADINAYMCVWYIRVHLDDHARYFEEFPKLRAWEARVKAIGHGTRTDISGAEALDIAKASTSTAQEAGGVNEPNGLKSGNRVTVTPDDIAKTPVEGRVVSLSAQHIAIKRSDSRVGEVVVWFPRVGYAVKTV